MSYIPLGCKRPVGYCKLHKKTMSLRQIKRKGCLKKQCWHLAKCNHPYWEQRKPMNKQKREKNLNYQGVGKE